MTLKVDLRKISFERPLNRDKIIGLMQYLVQENGGRLFERHHFEGSIKMKEGKVDVGAERFYGNFGDYEKGTEIHFVQIYSRNRGFYDGLELNVGNQDHVRIVQELRVHELTDEYFDRQLDILGLTKKH
ncbi:MAG: hypothetical protein Q7S56_02375 [Nanoarchaeota archaeon]|nr:hypothetical protein [Nanoarchaeota archaeon]